MPKRTRIYTRTGDDGTTGLVGSRRIRKNDLRIETYGTVDELSSAIGVARACLRPLPEQVRARVLDEWLAWVQDALFNLGTELATPPEDDREGAPSIRQSDVTALERAIDEAEADLEPLANFIHPGGAPAGAQLHVARTVCRRAERLLFTLGERAPGISPAALRFVNRLSDALFVWARWINEALDEPERLWNAKSEPPRPPA